MKRVFHFGNMRSQVSKPFWISIITALIKFNYVGYVSTIRYVKYNLTLICIGL